MNVRQECPELMTMGARPPRLDGDQIAAHVANLSQAPFRDLLMRLLEAAPDTESIREYVTKHPDKWCQAISMIGKLSGYHERLEVETSHSVALQQLSDSELMGRLQKRLRAAWDRSPGLQAAPGGKAGRTGVVEKRKRGGQIVVACSLPPTKGQDITSNSGQARRGESGGPMSVRWCYVGI